MIFRIYTVLQFYGFIFYSVTIIMTKHMSLELHNSFCLLIKVVFDSVQVLFASIFFVSLKPKTDDLSSHVLSTSQ